MFVVRWLLVVDCCWLVSLFVVGCVCCLLFVVCWLFYLFVISCFLFLVCWCLSLLLFGVSFVLLLLFVLVCR